MLAAHAIGPHPVSCGVGLRRAGWTRARRSAKLREPRSHRGPYTGSKQA
jgi:hypothetical protein